MKPGYWKYEDPKKQVVYFRGRVDEYDGSRVVEVHSCKKVHNNKFKAIEDAKQLIKQLKKNHGKAN